MLGKETMNCILKTSVSDAIDDPSARGMRSENNVCVTYARSTAGMETTIAIKHEEILS